VIRTASTIILTKARYKLSPMNRIRLLLAIFMAMIAVFVALRHRSLRQEVAEQTQLHRQIEEAKQLRSGIAQDSGAPPASSDTALSDSEHMELLRLRNEAGRLSRELVSETTADAVQTTNQPAKAIVRSVATNAFASAETRGESRSITHAGSQILLCRSWGELLIKHALKNGGQLPTTLAEVAVELSPSATAPNDLELVLTGNLNTVEFPSRTITLREKQPRKNDNGRWSRVYGFADGHVEVGSSATEDFTEWERQTTQVSPATAQ